MFLNNCLVWRFLHYLWFRWPLRLRNFTKNQSGLHLKLHGLFAFLTSGWICVTTQRGKAFLHLAGCEVELWRLSALPETASFAHLCSLVMSWCKQLVGLRNTWLKNTIPYSILCAIIKYWKKSKFNEFEVFFYFCFIFVFLFKLL